ncbi:TetR/AcrR family transcriptional regulator [Mycobacterium paraterrae]|uniref:TetR/AcrR family transcriptional regulator n=1 Tax=Mycobacterium paraterrae TaxID=577492 RepID=A0ABY3VT09_9MYCO|nr:TetR/AcrR family transcriptional regulator [Mycobacterium paraterrae]UMB70644.1 TetR/AcrR family transcriptional regulator [Mycobacterium paraterrae]
MNSKPSAKKRPASAASESPSADMAHRSRTGRVDRRQQLTDAALRLFSSRPYDEVFIDDIAAEAGVAHGLLSYYFGGKRGIYLAALEAVQADLAVLTTPLRSDGSTTAQIKGMARRHFEYFRAHPHLMLGLLNSAPTDAQTRAILSANQASGANALLKLLDLPTEPPPALETALRGCMGFLDAITVHWLTHGAQTDVALLVDMLYDVALAAIASAVGHDEALTILEPPSAAS